jgi:hypothetical protein
MDKEAFFAANQPRIIEREVTGVDGTLRFKALSAADRDKLMDVAKRDSITTSEYEAAVVMVALVNEDGSPAFTSDDLDSLRGMGAHALTALAVAAVDVLGIGVTKQAESA